MHSRLAEFVTDPEERARHLALADPARSGATSAALEAAAAGAELRGAISSAIVLSRLAVERTPEGEPDDEWRRRITLARHLFQAGESAAALDELGPRDAHCPGGRLRAEAELLIRDIAWVVDLEPAVALSAARRALAHAGNDPILRARALVAELGCNPEGMDTLAMAIEARRLLESAQDVDPRLLATVRMTEVGCRCLAGQPVEPDELWAIVARERDGGLWRSTDEAMWVLPVLLRWIDDDHGALAALDEMTERADEEGNESAMPYLLGHRVSTLLQLARYREAALVARQHLDAAEATRQDGQGVQGLLLLARVNAELGNFEAAAVAAREVDRNVSAADDSWLLASVAGVLGMIALRRGEHGTARREFDRWLSETRRSRIAGPAINHHYVDYVEATLLCGDRASAAAVVDDLVAVADRAQRPSAIAAGAHARALLAASDGELNEALATLDTLLARDDRGFNPVARGRALLLHGAVNRRLKRKAAARSSLEQARSLFEQVEASYWTALAEAELTRVGKRAADRLALTETERRIAELAAQGLTNREVAEQAFVSAKTVEANLSRAYSKLGIRSRAELGAWLAASRSANVASSSTT
jgi:DNA-binding NarL/FixJ family response regulator